jgi:hypothetical protein
MAGFNDLKQKPEMFVAPKLVSGERIRIAPGIVIKRASNLGDRTIRMAADGSGSKGDIAG